jgi:hypothetical protein
MLGKGSSKAGFLSCSIGNGSEEKSGEDFIPTGLKSGRFQRDYFTESKD